MWDNDYLCPDIMAVCDRKYLKGGAYYGVPKFVAVGEYWIVSPQGSVEIYYLEDLQLQGIFTKNSGRRWYFGYNGAGTQAGFRTPGITAVYR